MIGLNKIGLNQVQLNRLRLNAPFPTCRKMAGGGGSGDGFPVLPGDVTRWHFGGLTNEMMAAMDDPRIEDADGKGRFLSFKNFAWKGMSGVGGYAGDFSKWMNNRDTTEIGITESNLKVIIDVKVSQGAGKNIVFINKSDLGISNNVTIKITSTYPEGVMKFANSASNKYLKLPSNGVITLQDNPEYTRNEMYLHLESADLGQITIEQLPLYPGALVFDGVDDYGICDNFPVLTKEKGYTVVALRQYLFNATDKIRSLVTNAPSSIVSRSTLTFELIGSNGKKTNFSFGRDNPVSDFEPNVFSYMTSKSYNGKTITPGDVTESNKRILVGNFSENGKYGSNVAIWELVYLDHDATEEELTKIKDYFVKTYPWLFPDQAWTVTGKTNEDEDRATIANITGNGNDLVLSNFGFIEGSGYNEEGEYAGYLVTDGVDDEVRSAAFTLNEDWTIVGNWEFITNENKNAGLTKVYSLYLYNRDYGIFVYKYINAGQGFSVEDVKSLKAICSDGRIYLNDWQEIRNNIEQEATISKGVMAIGYFNRDFTKMAFKNLGIYNNQLLSKEDCIKAYNYLQTLKAK